jgi:hypothetical protein
MDESGKAKWENFLADNNLNFRRHEYDQRTSLGERSWVLMIGG